MRLLYNLSVNAYVFGIRISSLWNQKAKKWLRGRRDVWQKIDSFQKNDGPLYWFHCASLGEFEQGKPIMEELKNKGDCQIVITFFSPSGYEIRKDYEGADLIVYLPKDSSSNANRFISSLQPTAAFFIKYEFWANYIFAAKKNGTKLYSVSATFRKGQIFFKGYGGFMRSVLKAFDAIFVQNEDSKAMLDSIEIDCEISGDTRYDRVAQNAEKVIQYSEVEEFIDGKKVWILGSVWEEDMDVVSNTINTLDDSWKIIIAPHNIKELFIADIEHRVDRSISRYSGLDPSSDVLVIDNIGMLMNLYQYCDIAYVGGAFRTGLHNILEPAAFGASVIFGPYTNKFPEAQEFVNSGIGMRISNQEEFEGIFAKMIQWESKEKVREFMNSKKGATDKILSTTEL